VVELVVAAPPWPPLPLDVEAALPEVTDPEEPLGLVPSSAAEPQPRRRTTAVPQTRRMRSPYPEPLSAASGTPVLGCRR